MLKRLHLKNFTVFADADFEFSPGLNVLVGTNGTGKSHVLKLGYAVEMVRYRNKDEKASGNIEVHPKEDNWSSRLFYNLPDVFQIAERKQLVAVNARSRTATVKLEFNDGQYKSEAIEFEINAELDRVRVVGDGEVIGEKIEVSAPVFIPAKEILTLSWILPAVEQLIIPVEQNYLHLLNQLRLLPLRKPTLVDVIQVLAAIIGGEVQEQGDKYYLVDKSGRRTTISMVAEGLRKFGTLQKLLTNGSLTKNTTLYWDEPEANLNPALLRQLAAILAELARQGFQIILATHSMNLLKEFHILSRELDKEKLPIKYFGLNAEPGQPTTVVAREDFKYLPDVVALEVELDQADDLEEIFARENR